MVTTRNYHKKFAEFSRYPPYHRTGCGAKGLKNKRHYGAALLVALAVLAAVYAIRHVAGSGFDLDRFLASFGRLHPGWLAASVALVLLTYPGRAIRWRAMIEAIRPRASLTALLNATVIGFTAVTLFGRAGELVRPYLIAVKERVPLSSQLAVWFLERIYDLLFVILIFGFGLTRVKPKGAMSPALEWILNTGGYFVAGLGLLCVTLLVALSVFTEPATRRICDALAAFPEKYRARFNNLVMEFAGGMASSRRAAHVFKLLAYTAIEWLIIVASAYCLLRSFPPTSSLTITDSIVFTGFIAFGSVVQIPGIGGGMQVAAVLVLTELFGIAVESAAALALLLWVTTYVVIMPAGIVLALHQGLTWASLRHIKDRDIDQESTGVVEEASP
jgi:uncharacterized protein (TIRG00374 family)